MGSGHARRFRNPRRSARRAEARAPGSHGKRRRESCGSHSKGVLPGRRPRGWLTKTSPMLPRVLEPEVMDSLEEARDYDAMDHAQVNRVFVADLLSFWQASGTILDVGTGTAQIPLELCARHSTVQVV